MIEVNALTKNYGQTRGIQDITFSIPHGQIVGFLGPNGAGKTTTMNICAGFLTQDSGSVRIGGEDINKHPLKVKAMTGYLPEHPPLYLDMTVKEYLRFCYDLKKALQPKKEHIAEICDMLDITNEYTRVIKNLSKGVRQRVGLAGALIGDPKLLILDEPTTGLDPKQIIDTRKLIKKLGKDRTILLSTHILPEVSAVCERVIVISEGKIVADDRPENLAGGNKNDALLLRVSGSKQAVLSELKACGGVKSVEPTDEQEKGSHDFLVYAEGEIDIRKTIFKRLAQANLPILMMKPQNATLEEIFIQLTKR